MALTMSTGDLISIRLNFGLVATNDKAFNVLHYKILSQTGPAPAMGVALAAIAEDVMDNFSPLWDQASSNAVRFFGVTATNVFPLPRSVSQTYSPVDPVLGDIVSDALPLQDAPTLLKKTDVGERWGMGRLFFVGTPETGQHEGVLEGVQAGLLETFAQELAANINVAQGGWTAVLQPVLLSGPEYAPIRTTVITSGRLSDVILKTQRRRRPGKGV